MGFLKECFNREGRVNRQRYFFFTLSISLLFIFTNFIVIIITDLLFGDSIGKTISTIYIVLFGGVCAYINVLFGIKRFRDFGTSGWYSLLILLPYLNFFVYLVLLFFKGDEGTNEYGPDRLQEKPAQKLQPTEEQVL